MSTQSHANGTAPHPPANSVWLDAVAIVTVRAKATLGKAHHARLSTSQDLVISGAVTILDETNATVQGEAEYHVSLSTCTCPYFKSGRAPEDHCKHVLAVWIYRRAVAKRQELMARQVATISTEPLPEAPISISMRGTLAGVPDTMVTIRGQNMDEIVARVAEVKGSADCVAGLFDAGTSVSGVDASEAVADTPPRCPDHEMAMKRSKFGGWYCPKRTDEDTFCSHKIKANQLA